MSSYAYLLLTQKAAHDLTGYNLIPTSDIDWLDFTSVPTKNNLHPYTTLDIEIICMQQLPIPQHVTAKVYDTIIISCFGGINS